MASLTRRALSVLKIITAPQIVLLIVILLTAGAYTGFQESNNLLAYTFYIYTSCAGLGALLAINRNRQHINDKLYRSHFNGSFFALVGAILLFMSIIKHINIWIILPELLIKSYNYAADARPELYKVRSLIFDGSLEYAYLLLMGTFILPFNLRTKNYRSFALTIACIAFIGLIELLTLSRFTSAPLIVTFAISIHVIILNYKLVNTFSYRAYAASALLILFLATAPIFLRSVFYKHLPSLTSDAQTMSQGIEMRESSTGVVGGLSYTDGYDGNQVSKQWKKHRVNQFTIDDQKIRSDFICSTLAGPYLEDRFCSGYMHFWQKQAHSDFYIYTKGPVLSTSKYWEYSSNTARSIIAFNWACLLMPIVLVLLNINRSTSFLEAWLLSSPLFIIKLIGFFRGDPMHAGSHYLWILMMCMLTICFIKKFRLSFL